MSSAKSTFVSSLAPSASAASTSARLVRLLDPGGVIVAANGRAIGSMEIELLSDISLKVGRRQVRSQNP